MDSFNAFCDEFVLCTFFKESILNFLRDFFSVEFLFCFSLSSLASSNSPCSIRVFLLLQVSSQFFQPSVHGSFVFVEFFQVCFCGCDFGFDFFCLFRVCRLAAAISSFAFFASAFNLLNCLPVVRAFMGQLVQRVVAFYHLYIFSKCPAFSTTSPNLQFRLVPAYFFRASALASLRFAIFTVLNLCLFKLGFEIQSVLALP